MAYIESLDTETGYTSRPERVTIKMQLRSTGLTWQVIDEEIVVLDLDGSVYLQLNGSGRLLWEQLASPSSAAQLAEILVGEYGIDLDQAVADVDAFLDVLKAKQLLQE